MREPAKIVYLSKEAREKAKEDKPKQKRKQNCPACEIKTSESIKIDNKEIINEDNRK